MEVFSKKESKIGKKKSIPSHDPTSVNALFSPFAVHAAVQDKKSPTEIRKHCRVCGVEALTQQLLYILAGACTSYWTKLMCLK